MFLDPQGGFGIVVHCKKKSTGKHYAMKIQTKLGLLGCYPSNGHRVNIEKDALMACRHPFIISMDYAFQTKSLVMMVMDLGLGALSCPTVSCLLLIVLGYALKY